MKFRLKIQRRINIRPSPKNVDVFSEDGRGESRSASLHIAVVRPIAARFVIDLHPLFTINSIEASHRWIFFQNQI